MQLNLNISGYEGPLDLLLDLSKKQKVDIKKISILELANQYLEFINKNIDQIKLSADYLVMASLLAYLKNPNYFCLMRTRITWMRLKKILLKD